MDAASLAASMWPWLVATILATARPIGLVTINPVFTRAHLTGLLRGGVAIAIAIPEIPHLVTASEIAFGSPTRLLFLGAKEAALGAILGFLLGAPLWAFQFAGDVVDQQRGATSGRLTDPAGGDEVSVTGTLLSISGATLFVMGGGLEALASTIYASWAVWPIVSAMPAPTAQAPGAALGLLDLVARQGLLLAIPIVFAMLLVDLMMLLVGRFVQQLRIEDTSVAIRNLVFCLAMPLYCVFLLGFMRDDFLIPPGFLAALHRVLQ